VASLGQLLARRLLRAGDSIPVEPGAGAAGCSPLLPSSAATSRGLLRVDPCRLK